MPKVSVIIPVYNVEKYLRECLDSVVNQTLKDIEIICVDDGSTDNSGAILDEYAAADKRIKVIHQENGGLGHARNIGLDNISGEYVYFLDSDDYIDSALLEYAVNVFGNSDIDYLCFGSKAYSEDECTQSLAGINEYIRVKREGLFDLNFEIGLNTNIHVWNKVFKTSLIQKYNIRFIDKILYEDIYFMWHYFFVSKKAYFDKKNYHHYRIRSTSIMEKSSTHKTFDSGMAHLYNWHELMLTFSKNEELFLKNYDNILYLLDIYTSKTKEMVPACDRYKVELFKIIYQYELRSKIKGQTKLLEDPIIERIFSVKNSRDGQHKVVCCCGIKCKVKRKIKNGNT